MDHKIDVFQGRLYELINNSELPAGVVALVMRDALRGVDNVHHQMSTAQAKEEQPEEETKRHEVNVEVPLGDIPEAEEGEPDAD